MEHNIGTHESLCESLFNNRLTKQGYVTINLTNIIKLDWLFIENIPNP